MNIKNRWVRSICTFGPMTLFVTAMLLTGTVQAELSAWTGCVTPGGTIIHLARGDQPAKRCQENQQLLHLRNEAAFQNTDANYKQGASCKAFHELGLSATALENLGCPSTPTLTKPGIVSGQVHGSTLVANNFDVCGILKVETSDTWTPSWHWVVPKGFIVANVTLPVVTGQQENCRDLCVADDKCIAAYLDNTATTGGHGGNLADFGLCRIFHYSDFSNSDWSHFCGYHQGFDTMTRITGCADKIDKIDDTWFVRVPDGQTLDNCPGVAAIP